MGASCEFSFLKGSVYRYILHILQLALSSVQVEHPPSPQQRRGPGQRERDDEARNLVRPASCSVIPGRVSTSRAAIALMCVISITNGYDGIEAGPGR